MEETWAGIPQKDTCELGGWETALGEVSAKVGEFHAAANRLMETQRRTRRIWKEAKRNGL